MHQLHIEYEEYEFGKFARHSHMELTKEKIVRGGIQ
jgi:hypothetical protein